MQAAKLIPIVIIGGILLLAGVFFFVPSVRPGFVQKWFEAAKGFTPAKSPEDALEKFKLAIEKGDYEAAKLYLTGPYAEYFDKGRADALELRNAIVDLRAVAKDFGVQSDEVDLMLYWLDPFPAFKYTIGAKSEKSAAVTIHWDEDRRRFRDDQVKHTYKIKPLMLHSLLPTGTAVPLNLVGTVKEENGVWKIELPAQSGAGLTARNMSDCVEALRKSGTNYRNALIDVKTKIKNDAEVKIKANFEREFRTNLEKAT